MGYSITLSNVFIKGKADHELFFDYKVIGFLDYSFDYQFVFSILKKAIPDRFIEIKEDIPLTMNEILEIQSECKELINQLAKTKESTPEKVPQRVKEKWFKRNPGNIKEIFGKQVVINLRDPHDKILSTYMKIFEITEDCLRENKPMYFSILQY